jgi:hypothetical protein
MNLEEEGRLQEYSKANQKLQKIEILMDGIEVRTFLLTIG